MRIPPFALWPLAAVLLAGTAEAQPVSWFPLSAGMTREYRVHTDVMVDRDERPRVRSFMHERARVETVATDAPGRFEVRESRRRAGTDVIGGRGQTIVQRMAVTPWGITQQFSRKGRSGRAAPDGTTAEPIRFLPRKPRAGEGWEVGRLEHEGLVVDARAQAIALESVELGSETLSGCMRVEYRGDVAGRYRVSGEELDVDDGTWQADRWFCPDAGLVKSVLRIDLRLTLPDLREVHLQRLETQTLDPEATPTAPEA